MDKPRPTQTSNGINETIFINEFANQFLTPKPLIDHFIVKYTKQHRLNLKHLKEDQLNSLIQAGAKALDVSQGLFESRIKNGQFFIEHKY